MLKLNDKAEDTALFFVHGANIDEARGAIWGNVLFKRFWHTGFRGKFVNVLWQSDIAGVTDYQVVASNAFAVASLLAPLLNELQVKKVVMAHSLGNMLVSSMIQDYGLRVEKYLMCNSAVPAEAYDAAITNNPALVHPAWDEYPEKARANEWYKLFGNNQGDDRAKLTWRGRFADVVQKAVNFYSTGDHVLELAKRSDLGVLEGYENADQKLERYSWHKQELWKGRRRLLGYWGTTDWSGWSIRENVAGFNTIQPEIAWGMSEEALKTNTVFKLQPESMNTNTIPRLVLDAHLAQGIPAHNAAMGYCKPNNEMQEYNSIDLNLIGIQGLPRPNGWPERSIGFIITSNWGTRWLHSDIKDIAYYFTHKFFEKALEVGGLK